MGVSRSHLGGETRGGRSCTLQDTRTSEAPADSTTPCSSVGITGLSPPLFLRTKTRADLGQTQRPRWDDRGCIFSKSPVVQVVAFPPVFGGAVAPGLVRLR